METSSGEQEFFASDQEFHDARSRLSKSSKVKKLGRSAARKSKELLRRLDIETTDKHEEMLDVNGMEINGVTNNPIFNTGSVFQQRKTGIGQYASKTAGNARSAAHVVAHPKDAAKTKAARRFPVSEHPYLSIDADHELVEAHEHLELHQSGEVSLEESDALKQSKKVQELEARRYDLKSTWITSKHVGRARIVRRGQVEYPRVADYRTFDAKGEYVRFRWEMYIGHVLLYISEDFTSPYIDDSDAIPFKRGTLIHHAERFFIATTPWQEWLMEVRKAYLWEDPWLTGRWLLTFLLMLKTGYIATYFYLYIVFIVLKNKFFRTPARQLRESHERAMDRGRRVHNLGELVKRHGNDQWLDPLLDELGPLIMQQVGDLADYLEILMNFHNWSNTRATTHTIIFWLTCAAVSALASTEFGVKIVWWVCGFYFFFSRPIASRFPKYRHAVSILRWIYWDIPTHAELAFGKLQQKARRAQAEGTGASGENGNVPDSFEGAGRPQKGDRPSTTHHTVITSRSSSPHNDGYESSSSASSDYADASSSSLDHDILYFRGRWNGTRGYLMLNYTGVRFVRGVKVSSTRPDDHSVPADLSESSEGEAPKAVRIRKQLWSHRFEELEEIRKTKTVLNDVNKVTRKVVKKLVPSEALTLVWTDGSQHVVETMRKRDEAFNSIIGFSGTRWQVQDPIPTEGGVTIERRHGVRKDFFGEGHKTVFDELGKV